MDTAAVAASTELGAAATIGKERSNSSAAVVLDIR